MLYGVPQARLPGPDQYTSFGGAGPDGFTTTVKLLGSFSAEDSSLDI
jgi:hypothetical protein